MCEKVWSFLLIIMLSESSLVGGLCKVGHGMLSTCEGLEEDITVVECMSDDYGHGNAVCDETANW